MAEFAIRIDTTEAVARLKELQHRTEAGLSVEPDGIAKALDLIKVTPPGWKATIVDAVRRTLDVR